MARPKLASRNPRDGPPHAAYAASQPLYAALRTAINAMDQQKVRLSIARNMVQKLHVKLAAEDMTGVRDNAVYMNAIVTTWRAVTENYANIFDELANITAEDASEGKSKKKGHEELLELAGLVRTDLEAAQQFPLYDEVDSPVEGDHLSEALNEEKMKDAAADEDENERSDEPDNSVYFYDPPKKRSKRSSADSAERPKKMPRTSQDPDKNGINTHQPPTMPTPAQTAPAPPPGVEFEDVTAEVEARLEAKRIERKERKKEKKRKRQSVESMETEGVNGAAAEKPAKKKSKGGRPEPGMQAEVVVGTKRGHEGGGDGGGSQQTQGREAGEVKWGPGKRKKTKA